MMPRPVLQLSMLALLVAAGGASARDWTYRGTLNSHGKAAQGVPAQQRVGQPRGRGRQPEQ